MARQASTNKFISRKTIILIRTIAHLGCHSSLKTFKKMVTFSADEKRQDLLLGVAFLLITIFSFFRIFNSFSPSRGRTVITTFNLLIFAASALRTIWFLIPNDILEVSYAPTPLKAFQSNGWIGALLSEILLVCGSLSLYGIFILVTCYWIHMLQKLRSESINVRFQSPKQLATIEMFSVIMLSLGSLQALSIVLFLFQVFNSEQMILYDSIILSLASLVVLVVITILSQQIKLVLNNLEVMNSRNAQPQIRRIFSIIIVANIFFISRVVLECTLAICLVVLMKDHHSFSVLLSDKYWTVYIALKHSCEIIVLALELVISTAIKSYDIGSSSRRSSSYQPISAQQQQPPQYYHIQAQNHLQAIPISTINKSNYNTGRDRIVQYNNSSTNSNISAVAVTATTEITPILSQQQQQQKQENKLTSYQHRIYYDNMA